MRRARLRFSLRGLLIVGGMSAFTFAAMDPRGAPLPVNATSSDPRIATRQEKVLHGTLWAMSYEQAREQARREKKPILIFFSGIADVHSRVMELNVLPRPDVVPRLAEFVTVQLFIDWVPIQSLTRTQRVEIAKENLEHEVDLTRAADTPEFVALDSSGRVIASLGGERTTSEFIAFLNRVRFTPQGRPTRTWRFQTVKNTLALGLTAVGIGGLLRSKQRRPAWSRRAEL